MYFPEYNKAVRLYLVAIFRSLEVNKFIFIYIYTQISPCGTVKGLFYSIHILAVYSLSVYSQFE